MRQYLDLLDYILREGSLCDDRTGVGTRSIFGYQMRFDLRRGFPLQTTKTLHMRSIIYELLWFLRGETNIGWLNENGVRIWDDWANAQGDLGPIYGYQWRSWRGRDGKGIDQIGRLIEGLRKNPSSRRHIVSAWNVSDLDDMGLPPCHCLFQFYVSDGYLSCHLYQRSADIFLGVPFNIASYALLTHMVAHILDLGVGAFIHSFGDVHLYNTHLRQAKEILRRSPFALPRLEIRRKVRDINDFRYDDFNIIGYVSHPHIGAPIAV